MTASASNDAAPGWTGRGVLGLHHVALVARDASRTADFYARVLGLAELGGGDVPVAAGRDAIAGMSASPARWFGANESRAAGLVAVVERPGAEGGAPGIGGTHHFALCVDDRDALLMWKRRLLDAGFPVNGILDRHYFQSIYTKDPDGTIVELATRGPGWTIDEAPDRIGEAHRGPPAEMVNTNRDRARIAAESWPEPVGDIAERMRIRGMHHVTAIGESIERTHAFVAGGLGMRRVKRTNNFDDIASFHWYWGVDRGRPGTLVTYFERSPSRERPARMGAGQVAHYALALSDDALDPLGASLADAARPVSVAGALGPDGARFRALATRDPDGQPVIVAAEAR